MKTTMKLFMKVLVLFALVATSCSKDGAVGPIGPQGAAGEIGPAGPEGAQGETGTANVIYSDWISVKGDSWVPNTGSVILKRTKIDAPEITQEYIDTAVILVYVQNIFTTEPNSIVPLPMDDGAFQFLIQGIDVGQIDLKARKLDLTSFTTSFIDLPFRYVIIPGGLATKGLSQPDFKKMTYQEVVNYFEIPY